MSQTSLPNDALDQSLQEALGLEPSKGKRLLRWFITLLILGGIGYGAWFYWNKQQQTAQIGPKYIFEKLERGNVDVVITATGTLQPTNEVTIGSELSGTVETVYVDINDRVTKDQPLAKLDTEKLSQQTERSRASLNSARARLNQAQATEKEQKAKLARLQELHKLSQGKMPSKSEMDAAEAAAERASADVLSAQASVEEAEATLRANESDLDKTIIKSPIDGMVLSRSIEPGQTVAASFTAPELFILAENLEQMELLVNVAESDIGRLKEGQEATFTVDAWPDRTYKANVTRVSFGANKTDTVVTYGTELQVSNQDLSLRPGMTATADITVAKSENVLLVPAAALRFDPERARAAAAAQPGGDNRSFVQSLVPGPPGRGMFRGGSRGRQGGDNRSRRQDQARIWVLKDGKPEAIPVKIGLTDGTVTEVSGEGLTEGMEFILRLDTNG